MSPYALASEWERTQEARRQSPAATIEVRPQDWLRFPVRFSQLEPVLGFESARWLPSLLSDLRLLETSGQNIPGVGDFRVSHTTADHVRRLITITSGAPLPEPTLAPFSGGGVALTWSIGDRELMFTAYPDHDDFVFMRTDDNDELADDGNLKLDQTKELGDVITAFLANPAR
jgi:hypothetical protein